MLLSITFHYLKTASTDILRPIARNHQIEQWQLRYSHIAVKKLHDMHVLQRIRKQLWTIIYLLQHNIKVKGWRHPLLTRIVVLRGFAGLRGRQAAAFYVSEKTVFQRISQFFFNVCYQAWTFCKYISRAHIYTMRHYFNQFALDCQSPPDRTTQQ